MLIYTTIAPPMAMRVRMPALAQGSGTGASVEGGRIAAGTTVSAYSTHLPAFGKDVFEGVRAWSPPV